MSSQKNQTGKSDQVNRGAAMATKKPDSRFKPWESCKTKGRHIRVADDMFSSSAWNDLSMAAKVLYPEFKRKYTGSNEKDISFTYAEGMKLMHQQTFQKAVQELITHGFITLISEGYFMRKCNIYAFSDGWRVYPNNV